MSARLVGWALQQKGLDTQEKLLLVILADHFNDQEGAAWPSQARVAEMMGVSDRQVRRIQLQLINKELLEVEQRAGQSNIYRMHTPDIDVLPTPDIDVRIPRTSMSYTPDTAVLHNSYLTLNEHKKSKFKKEQQTPTPPKYKPPKDESVKPQRAQEHIKEIRRKLKAV